MRAFRYLAILFFTSMLLLACSSSPPVRYFALAPIDAELEPAPDDAIMLGLGPLRMPDYLDRSQIVTRGANSAIDVDEFNRWSEPLARSILRIVSTDVDSLLPNVVVVVYPYEPFLRDKVSYQLAGEINRFEANYEGRVVLEVQWGVVDSDDRLLIPIRRNRYQAQAEVADDPGAIATAMNDALSQFSRDIVRKLASAL